MSKAASQVPQAQGEQTKRLMGRRPQCKQHTDTEAPVPSRGWRKPCGQRRWEIPPGRLPEGLWVESDREVPTLTSLLASVPARLHPGQQQQP